ncbi:hypothetical protein BST81_13765 [Leptolyngbya sp. 'hensonii']|uniref:hypothetical protein n=1 Tax=Leptolyngbya sp. 'hensonii' TaxID=1922337 RepID=UPI0009500DC6|nr:hypothetical protein [Leptolyngbya sp. 'hensonii']OLP18087.1 hypothetical protein BST81_13765 [Leptolyngbya sp. 'hensonii']
MAAINFYSIDDLASLLGGAIPAVGVDAYLVKVGAYSAHAGDRILASLGANWTLTLPASPEEGDFVEIETMKSNFLLTIARNGNLLNGQSRDGLLRGGNHRVLIYSGAVSGWYCAPNVINLSYLKTVTASGWSPTPGHLSYATDGNIATATDLGSPPNDNVRCRFVVDLGVISSGTFTATVVTDQGGGGFQLGIEHSPNGSSWTQLTEDIIAVTKNSYVFSAAVNNRYISFYAVQLSGDARLGIQEFELL